MIITNMFLEFVSRIDVKTRKQLIFTYVDVLNFYFFILINYKSAGFYLVLGIMTKNIPT